jgi:hypothetical protein
MLITSWSRPGRRPEGEGPAEVPTFVPRAISSVDLYEVFTENQILGSTRGGVKKSGTRRSGIDRREG